MQVKNEELHDTNPHQWKQEYLNWQSLIQSGIIFWKDGHHPTKLDAVPQANSDIRSIMLSNNDYPIDHLP